MQIKDQLLRFFSKGIGDAVWFASERSTGHSGAVCAIYFSSSSMLIDPNCSLAVSFAQKFKNVSIFLSRMFLRTTTHVGQMSHV